MNAATEAVDSRWPTADRTTTTTTTDSTSSAASTVPSSANPLWSQPLAADGTRSASLMPKIERGAEDPAEELADPVADGLAGVICRGRGTAPGCRIGLATAPITPIAIVIATPKPSGDLERADRPAAQHHHDRVLRASRWSSRRARRRSGGTRPTPFGSHCSSSGSSRRSVSSMRGLPWSSSSAAWSLDSDLALLLAELPKSTDRDAGRPRSMGASLLRAWFYVALPRRPGRFLGWVRSVAAVTALRTRRAHPVEHRQAVPARARGERHSDRADAVRGRRRRASAVPGDIVVKPSSEPARSACVAFGDDPGGAHEHIDALRSRARWRWCRRPVGDRLSRRDRSGVRGWWPQPPFRKDRSSRRPSSGRPSRQAACSPGSRPPPRPPRRRSALSASGSSRPPATAYARSTRRRPTRSGAARAGGGRAVAVPAPRRRAPGACSGRVP